MSRMFCVTACKLAFLRHFLYVNGDVGTDALAGKSNGSVAHANGANRLEIAFFQTDFNDAGIGNSHFDVA